PVLDCAELHFLHLQYIDPARTASKQRWYQCYERLRQPETSPVRLFDQYHHMHAIRPEQLRPVPAGWLAPYREAGIDLLRADPPADGLYYWDPLVLEIFREHGLALFARDCLWDGWPETARRLGAPPELARDPRSFGQRLAHRLLQRTNRPKKKLLGRLTRSVLKRSGW
ncbi:MAG: glycosyltransferase, partial [Verrucomicrobiota bacterium]